MFHTPSLSSIYISPPHAGAWPETEQEIAMAMFRRSKDVDAGRFKPTAGCRKHPKHHQSPGVCSLCLREKLSQLSTSSSRSIAKARIESYSSSSSLSPDYSSSSASSCSSPVDRYDLLDGFLSGNNKLTKSRTITFVTKRREKEGDQRKNNRTGFLSKLLHPIKRKEEGLMHSKTVRVH